jgi:hypothetical protein
MAYNALIERNVTLAFNLVKDLAVNVVFTKTTSANFDFNTASLNEVTGQVKTIKAILFDGKKPTKDATEIVKTIMFKSSDIDDVNLYDTISYKGKIFKIDAPIKDFGFIWIFNIIEEL